MMRKRSDRSLDAAPAIAGNGLIDRRALLGRGVVFAGAIGTGVGPSLTSAAAEPLSSGATAEFPKSIPMRTGS
jgi:sulfane dehydrogenase subunit SoxC